MAEPIESTLLKVPFEALKRSAKDRKGLIDEASEALAALGPLDSANNEEQLAGFDQLVNRLQGLKRKLADVSHAERDEAARCKARLEHLVALGAPARGATVAWHRPRLDRILVDHLLRSDCHVSAAALAASAQIEPLCDLHVFDGARCVADALRARDAAPALAWCAEQRGRLKKAKSPLEFKLRLQEFVELLRKVRGFHLRSPRLKRHGTTQPDECMLVCVGVTFGPDPLMKFVLALRVIPGLAFFGCPMIVQMQNWPVCTFTPPGCNFAPPGPTP